jgi:L-fuconolactonase
LSPLLDEAGVDATVLVQAVQHVDETRWFLETAAATAFIAGVVGWIDLLAGTVDETLAGLKARPNGRYLVGIRHMVQDEPDPEWLLRPEVGRGLMAVGTAGLAYDLLLKPPQIAAATRSARQCRRSGSSSTTSPSRRSPPARSGRGRRQWRRSGRCRTSPANSPGW